MLLSLANWSFIFDLLRLSISECAVLRAIFRLAAETPDAFLLEPVAGLIVAGSSIADASRGFIWMIGCCRVGGGPITTSFRFEAEAALDDALRFCGFDSPGLAAVSVNGDVGERGGGGATATAACASFNASGDRVIAAGPILKDESIERRGVRLGANSVDGFGVGGSLGDMICVLYASFPQ